MELKHKSKSQLLGEVVALRQKLNEMSATITRLEREEADLKRIQTMYHAVLDTADDAIFIKDAEGRYVVVNSVLAMRIGISKEDLLAKTPMDVYPVELGAKIRENDLQTLTTGRIEENEDRMVTEEGKRVFLARKVPIRDEDGQIVGLLGISRDITERKRLEEELERSNADLEQFAYVASHDLQEPLRMVSSFVQLLARRSKGKLDPDCEEFIGFAVDGAERMRVLIDDLLAYSRVGRQEIPADSVPCGAVFERVTTNLRAAIEESGAVLSHDRLPVVKGSEVLLGQLLQNLIANALKFQGQERPEVHVGVERADGEWLVSVRDNGIGIDPKHFERIFAVFQRLHGRSEYPGTGIGLAICKKIVERHGGQIWVQSSPGSGSTFFFTLPVADLEV